jgi:hypothetical protein
MPQILTGHAFRMSRRLGMHLDDVVYAREKHLWIGEQGQRRVERYITRRRVWLALSVYDCLFSLGFGRPPSQPQMDAAETGAFLNLIMARFEQSGGRTSLQEPGRERIATAVTGDVFIACQVELLQVCLLVSGCHSADVKQIARDFRAEIDQMRDNVEAQAVLNRTPGDGLTSAILTMCGRLNQRLDQWEERWSPVSDVSGDCSTADPVAENPNWAIPSSDCPTCTAVRGSHPTLHQRHGPAAALFETINGRRCTSAQRRAAAIATGRGMSRHRHQCGCQCDSPAS